MSEAKETRVSMNWPEDLREEVRQLVGARGTTAFTIEAVREKLARQKADAPATPELQPTPAAAPSPAKATGPAPAVRDEVQEQDEAQGEAVETRGPAVDVAPPPTLGVAAKFNSSGDAVLDLLNRAQELGMKRASEIPMPVREEISTAEDVPTAEEVVEEPEEDAPTPEPAPTPAPIPVATPAPAVSRDLDDIEVGF